MTHSVLQFFCNKLNEHTMFKTSLCTAYSKNKNVFLQWMFLYSPCIPHSLHPNFGYKIVMFIKCHNLLLFVEYKSFKYDCCNCIYIFAD